MRKMVHVWVILGVRVPKMRKMVHVDKKINDYNFVDRSIE